MTRRRAQASSSTLILVDGLLMSAGCVFWTRRREANGEALKVCWAALTLAKRGFNVDQVFFLWDLEEWVCR